MGGCLLKELLLKRRGRFILYLVACFIPVIDNLLVNASMALLIGSVEKGSLEYFIKILIFSIAIIALGTIMYIFSRFMRISYMRDTFLDVRVKAFDKILKSSYKNFSKKSKDTYVSNLINDINVFENTFFLKLINFIFCGGVYLVSVIVLLVLDYKFAITMITVSIILFFISKAFENKTVKLQEEISQYNENFVVDISNTFNGLEILKLNNIEDKFLLKALKSIIGLERKKFSYTFFTDLQQRIINFLGYIIFIGTLFYASTLISKGTSLTKIAFMIQMSSGCIWHISTVLPLLNELKSASKIYNKITKDEEEKEITINKEEDFSFESEISVKNLSFSYEGKEIFKDVSFKIEKGKKYLLKGASGAGKSTLIKLLSMVYEDYKGEITVDGVDYRDIKESSLNEKVSFIYQDVFLFEDTIFNNIALFKPFSQEEVLNSAKKAGLEGLLNKKENGLNEMLMENGKNLSGGERQRISIARAIVKDSKILFVDEGTSSLDEELGKKVEDTILNLPSTVIAISHRYYEGITEKYDYVLEVKNGKVNQYSAERYFEEVAL